MDSYISRIQLIYIFPSIIVTATQNASALALPKALPLHVCLCLTGAHTVLTLHMRFMRLQRLSKAIQLGCSSIPIYVFQIDLSSKGFLAHISGSILPLKSFAFYSLVFWKGRKKEQQRRSAEQNVCPCRQWNSTNGFTIPSC